jgi:hypothetical protein
MDGPLVRCGTLILSRGGMPQRVYLHNDPLASPPLFKDSEGEGVQCERSGEYLIGTVESQPPSNCHCEEPVWATKQSFG